MQVADRRQVIELAHKHRIDPKLVEYRLTQLRAVDVDARCFQGEDLSQLISELRSQGKHHQAAMLWFCKTRQEQEMGLFDAMDLLIALTIGES
jgi:hypothetical protein